MKYRAAIVVAAVALFPLIQAGCQREVSHTEEDKTNILGQHKHEDKTVYQNPDGTTTVKEHDTKN